MDREQKVLEFLKKIAGKPLKVSEIAILLDVPKNQYKDLQSILNNLISQGKLFSTPRNKYFVPDDEKYKIGTLRTNQKSFGFVKIEDSSEIFISRDNMKNAMNNDKVLVRKIKQSTNIGKNPEGKIVHIIEHGTDNVVGVFYKERNFGFVVPEGPTIIDDIYVQKKILTVQRMVKL